MQQRTKSLIVLLCLVAALAGLLLRNRANQPPAMSDELSEAFRTFHSVEQLPNPKQRCMTYPQPSWIHWDHAVIEAFCRSRSFKYMPLTAIKAALDAGHPEVLEQAFASYLSDNFSKPESHGILTRAYRELFWKDGEQVRDVVERWVALAPESAYALAARGAYLQAAAGDARGGNYMRDTPEENRAAMGKLAAQAQSDLRAATAREPKLTAAYDTMVFVGRLTGDGELVNYALGAGMREDPTDERFYLDWMAVSEPRWGGSLQAMADVADKAIALKTSNPLMNLIKEKQYAYFGDMATQAHAYAQALNYYDQGFAYGPSVPDLADAAYAAIQVHEYEKAVWYYSEAIRLGADAPAENLHSRAWLLGQLGRPDLAAEDMRAVASLTATDPDTLMAKGAAYWTANQLADAEKSYLAALQLNPRNQQALESIVKLYMWKETSKAKPYIVQLEELYPTAPRTWDLSAQFYGGVDDIKQRYALRRYLAVVDKNEPYERECIERSKAQLQALDRKLQQAESGAASR